MLKSFGEALGHALLGALRDLAPIILVIGLFQALILRQPFPNLLSVLGGLGLVVVGLAYDSGGVTTSTVTVPLVAALGLGLASNVPGRSPVMDGFGLIAFASVFPIISVLGYAQLAQWITERRSRGQTSSSART